MSLFLRLLIGWQILSLISISTFSQGKKFRVVDTVVSNRIVTAIHNSEDFIKQFIEPSIFEKHFRLDTLASQLFSDRPYLIRRFGDSINFFPVAYHVAFKIFIDSDTLTRLFKIKTDSLGNVRSDIGFLIQDIQAWNKALTNQFPYGYYYAKNFIIRKKIKRGYVSFVNQLSINEATNSYNHYWAIWARKGSSWEIIYLIDPMTGKKQTPPSVRL